MQTQTNGKPLFSDVLWSRPERKTAAGKLAIIGGSSSGFSAVSETYTAATKAGAGQVRILLPDSLKKSLSSLWPESEFAPANKGGGFAAAALGEWLALAEWADAVMLCGNLGKSSETAVLLEHFLEKYEGQISLAKDSIQIALGTPTELFDQKELTLIVELSDLQRLLSAIRFPMAVRSDMTIYQLGNLLRSLSQSYPWAIVTEHEGSFFASFAGNVSHTMANAKRLLAAGSAASVWRMQQPLKPYEALSSGIYDLISRGDA